MATALPRHLLPRHRAHRCSRFVAAGRGVFVVLLALLLSSVSSGCTDDELPTVWIQSAEPTVAAPSMVIHLFGRGLAVSTSSAGSTDATTSDATTSDATTSDATTSSSSTAGCPTSSGLDAVTVGGIAADVCYRSDDRIDLVVPTLPAGPHHVVVFSGGTASNAVVIHVLQTTP